MTALWVTGTQATSISYVSMKLAFVFTNLSTAGHRFKLNKIPLWRQHQALAVSFTSPRLLFPESLYLPKGSSLDQDSVKPFNSLIASNPKQLQAVASIKNAPLGSLPFIVFGP